MKNFLIILSMVLIVIGTVFGVYYEVQMFNKSHSESYISTSI